MTKRSIKSGALNWRHEPKGPGYAEHVYVTLTDGRRAESFFLCGAILCIPGRRWFKAPATSLLLFFNLFLCSARARLFLRPGPTSEIAVARAACQRRASGTGATRRQSELLRGDCQAWRGATL